MRVQSQHLINNAKTKCLFKLTEMMPVMILRQQADIPRACNASHIYIFKGKKGQQSWMELAGVEKVQFKASQSSSSKFNSGHADVDGALFQFRVPTNIGAFSLLL